MEKYKDKHKFFSQYLFIFNLIHYGNLNLSKP